MLFLCCRCDIFTKTIHIITNMNKRHPLTIRNFDYTIRNQGSPSVIKVL